MPADCVFREWKVKEKVHEDCREQDSTERAVDELQTDVSRPHLIVEENHA